MLPSFLLASPTGAFGKPTPPREATVLEVVILVIPRLRSAIPCLPPPLLPTPLSAGSSGGQRNTGSIESAPAASFRMLPPVWPQMLAAAPATDALEKRRLTAGRALLSEVAEGLVLADAIVAQLITLAERASDGVPALGESFSDGLCSLTAMAAGGSSLTKRLLGGSGEPIALAEGLLLSLPGLSPGALGLSELCLHSPPTAGAAVELLAAAPEKIQAQLSEVDRADEILEARDQRLFFKAG